MIRLLDKNEFHMVSGGQYEKDYLLPMMVYGTDSLMSNISTQMHMLQVGEHLFPTTVNDAEYENAYTCSPYTTYISYAQQELGKLHNKPLEATLGGILGCLSPTLKAGEINRVVCVNNWLLSTNLYPDWNGNEINQVTDLLVSSFPSHAIMFRSLNHYSNAALIDALTKSGYLLVPSREIYIFDHMLKRYMKKRNTIIDRKLLNKTLLQIVQHDEFVDDDFPRITELYRLLYFEKYSSCSPKFTERFIRLCHEKKLLNFQGLRNQNGEIDAIVGSFSRNKTLATPLVGYNIARPLQDGLFRMLTALALLEAFEKKWPLNISGGVSQFKEWRGALPYMEYSAIYRRHLPVTRRSVWRILHFLMQSIGVPLMHKFKF